MQAFQISGINFTRYCIKPNHDLLYYTAISLICEPRSNVLYFVAMMSRVVRLTIADSADTNPSLPLGRSAS